MNMKYLVSIFLFLISSQLFSQSISGLIVDEQTNEPIVGASVGIKGTKIAGSTDFDGKFELKTSQQAPFTLMVSFLGYAPSETEIKSITDKLKIKLKSNEVDLSGVEIVGSRITEKQKESPVTVESMDIIAIKSTPSPSFY